MFEAKQRIKLISDKWMLNRLFFVNCLIVQLFLCFSVSSHNHCLRLSSHFLRFYSFKIHLSHSLEKSVHSHIFGHCSFVVQTDVRSATVPQKKRPQISKYRDFDKKSAFVSRSGNIHICLPVSPVPWALSERNEIRSEKNCIHVVFSVKLATVQCYSEPNRYEWKSKGNKTGWRNGSSE